MYLMAAIFSRLRCFSLLNFYFCGFIICLTSKMCDSFDPTLVSDKQCFMSNEFLDKNSRATQFSANLQLFTRLMQRFSLRPSFIGKTLTSTRDAFEEEEFNQNLRAQVSRRNDASHGSLRELGRENGQPATSVFYRIRRGPITLTCTQACDRCGELTVEESFARVCRFQCKFYGGRGDKNERCKILLSQFSTL